MFCPNCGKQLSDTAKFCTGCGTPMQSAPVATPQPAPAPQPVQSPNAPKKAKKDFKKWIPLISVVAAALLLIALVVILLVSGVFGGPKAKVFSAFVKSAGAFAECGDAAGLPKPDYISNSGAASHSLAVGVQSLPAVPEAEMLDLQVDLAANIEKREVYLSVLPTVASMDFFKVQVALEDEMLLVSAPNLLEDRVFAVNTTTLGSDLYELDLISSEAETLGFNVFELIDIVKEYTQPDPDAKKELTKIAKDLVKAIEVERTGKEDIRVHDRNLKATVYRMTIPAEALEDACRALMDIYGNQDSTEILAALLEAIGMPDELIDEALYNMDMDYAAAEVEDALDMAMDYLEDIELDVFVNKGYICAIESEISVDAVDTELRLLIGNKENYVDALTLELNLMDEVFIEVNSSGNHAYKNKEFSDITTVTISGDYMDSVWVESEMHYMPKKSSENFEWSVTSDFFRADVSGQIDAERNALSVNLESIRFDVAGENVIRCSVAYTGLPYEAAPIEGDEPIEVLKLSYDEIMELGEELTMELEEKVMDIMGNNPAAFEMIEGMM